MERIVVIKRFLSLLLVVFVSGCGLMVDTYKVEDATKERIFTPLVRSLASVSYSIHVEGYLEGRAELHLVSPDFDTDKGLYCSDLHVKLDSGVVNQYINGDYFGSFERPKLCYLPCSVKKGKLTIRIAFDKFLNEK